MLERLIAYHCGPALAGIKPANLAACYKERIPGLRQKIANLNTQLNGMGIYADILCECDRRVLVMVYRKRVLEKHLQSPEMAAFLRDFGYPRNVSVRGYVNHLRTRLRQDSFPHEIGVFLGYPLHDIHGFIHHPAAGCLLVGEWKVYRDAEGARKLFDRYSACRKALLKRVAHGFTLAQIFRAA